MNIRSLMSHQIPDSSEVKYCIFCILYCNVGLIWISFVRLLFGSVSFGFVCFFFSFWIIVFIGLYCML